MESDCLFFKQSCRVFVNEKHLSERRNTSLYRDMLNLFCVMSRPTLCKFVPCWRHCDWLELSSRIKLNSLYCFGLSLMATESRKCSRNIHRNVTWVCSFCGMPIFNKWAKVLWKAGLVIVHVLQSSSNLWILLTRTAKVKTRLSGFWSFDMCRINDNLCDLVAEKHNKNVKKARLQIITMVTSVK